VKKTTVYLDPAVDRALAHRARAEGITKAEAIRRTLAAAVADAPRRRIAAIGVGRGPGDVADETDRHLSESGFGDDR
jgi:hypothetical protein